MSHEVGPTSGLPVPPEVDAAMTLALHEAREAALAGEVPVGAVVLCGIDIVARAQNRMMRDGDATSHAELLALAHPQLDAAAINDGPSLHLITDDPRAARGVLSTGVRVHMVTTVTVQGRANWVCNPLN